MNNIVNVEDKAFMAILLSAVEAFPSRYSGSRRPNGSTPEGEVHGLLFGQRIMRDAETTVYNVTLAVSNQIVLERTGDGVSVSTVHIDRIREERSSSPPTACLAFSIVTPGRRMSSTRSTAWNRLIRIWKMPLMLPGLKVMTCSTSSSALPVWNVSQRLSRIFHMHT